jgi:hypothetical protein
MFNIGGASSASKGKSSTKWDRDIDYWTPQQKKTASQTYTGVIAPGFRKYGDVYSGQPTDIEQMGINQLSAYGQGGQQLVGQGEGALSRAMTGQGYQDIVDPAAAERLYASIEQSTMKDILPKAIESASTQANVGGMLRGGTGQQLITDEIGRIVRALAEQKAGLQYKDEQDRRTIGREREARQLQGLGQMGQQYNQIAPLLQMGGMERDIAGTRFNNPLTQLAMQYLGLRGQQEGKGKTDTSRWDIGTMAKGGFGME